MSTLSLEWGSDFVVSQSGGLVLIAGFDEARQRITRRMLTNRQQVLPDGTPVAGDLVFDPEYGIGLRRMVNQLNKPDLMAKLKQMITQGVQTDVEADTTTLPTVQFTTQGRAVFITATIKLSSGDSGQVAFQVQ